MMELTKIIDASSDAFHQAAKLNVTRLNATELTKLVSSPWSLQFWQDTMTGKDYAEHMLAHLIDGLDCINARLVYLRAADVFKKKSKELETAWCLC